MLERIRDDWDFSGAETEAKGTGSDPTTWPGVSEQMPSPVSFPSRAGLNAANFFLAEVLGVVLPLLGIYLQGRWDYLAIGIATSLAGLGVFLMQTPAGYIVDRVRSRRLLLAAASVLLGVCFGLVPLVPVEPGWVDPLLFLGGVCQAFFAPLLGALALGLVGHARLSKTMGVNQGWNHAGNIAAALAAMALVEWVSLESVFFAITAVSVLAGASVFLIRKDELDETRAAGDGDKEKMGLRQLFRDRRVVILFLATALFHLANAPVMPMVAMDIKALGGSNTQATAVVLVAQTVMIPVALAAGWLCDRWGRKPVFAVGFVVLPLRIFLYSLTDEPWVLVALQSLDGIGAGIYGVAIVDVCADLTQGKGGFNALVGLTATAQAVGGVVGPLGSDYLIDVMGFNTAFHVFAGVAAVGAAVFVFLMPETCPDKTCPGSARAELV